MGSSALLVGLPRTQGPGRDGVGWQAAFAAKTEIAWAGAHVPETVPTGPPGLSTYTAPLCSGGLSWTGRSVPGQLRAEETVPAPQAGRQAPWEE